MSETRKAIYERFEAERAAQSAHGYDEKHDDSLVPGQFVNLLLREVGLSVNPGGDVDLKRYIRQLVRAGALATAALEQIARKYPFAFKPVPGKTRGSEF